MKRKPYRYIKKLPKYAKKPYKYIKKRKMK